MPPLCQEPSLTIAASQRTEIRRYEAPREVSFPGFGMEIILVVLQITGIRHGVTEVVEECSEIFKSLWVQGALGRRY